MTRKIVRTSNSITDEQGEALLNAFERFDPDERYSTIKVPQAEHIVSEWMEGVSCSHKWKKFSPTAEDAAYLFTITEEDPRDADTCAYCQTCGAVSYYDTWPNFSEPRGVAAQGPWLYDGTTRFYGKAPKRDRKGKRNG